MTVVTKIDRAKPPVDRRYRGHCLTCHWVSARAEFPSSLEGLAFDHAERFHSHEVVIEDTWPGDRA